MQLHWTAICTQQQQQQQQRGDTGRLATVLLVHSELTYVCNCLALAPTQPANQEFRTGGVRHHYR